MKTQLEILDETVKYYEEHKRAIRGDACYYKSPKGNKCAIGRLMTDYYLKKYKDSTRNIAYLGNDGDNGILNTIVKSEYRGYSIEFWMKLQKLHDQSSFWDDCDGFQVLSKKGLYKYEDIKNQLPL